jgi:uncharacterized protein (TIGR03067 family)
MARKASVKQEILCLSAFTLYLILSITTIFATEAQQVEHGSENQNVGKKVIIHGCDGTEWVTYTGVADTQCQAELLGTWIGREADGPGEWHITFNADGLFEISGPGGEWHKGSYACDDDKDPKHLNLYIKQSHDPTYLEKTCFAIYRIDGNTLTYAAQKPEMTNRPSSLGPGNGGRVFEFVKKR